MTYISKIFPTPSAHCKCKGVQIKYEVKVIPIWSIWTKQLRWRTSLLKNILKNFPSVHSSLFSYTHTHTHTHTPISTLIRFFFLKLGVQLRLLRYKLSRDQNRSKIHRINPRLTMMWRASTFSLETIRLLNCQTLYDKYRASQILSLQSG